MSNFNTIWAPYKPNDKNPWNLRRVVPLHRRAGFAAIWSEIQRDLKDGPKASIDRLLSGKVRGRGVLENFGGEVLLSKWHRPATTGR